MWVLLKGIEINITNLNADSFGYTFLYLSSMFDELNNELPKLMNIKIKYIYTWCTKSILKLRN